jgi:hypothetical protein
VAYTDDDFRDLLRALEKYADESLDQFDHLRLDRSYGPVFVAISLEPPAGHPRDLFRPVASDMQL